MNSRIVNSDNERLTDTTDEAVIFDAPGQINFLVPASQGDGKIAYLKNISEFPVLVHVSGLADLTVPRMASGTVKTLGRFEGIMLLAYKPDAWVLM